MSPPTSQMGSDRSCSSYGEFMGVSWRGERRRSPRGPGDGPSARARGTVGKAVGRAPVGGGRPLAVGVKFGAAGPESRGVGTVGGTWANVHGRSSVVKRLQKKWRVGVGPDS